MSRRRRDDGRFRRAHFGELVADSLAANAATTRTDPGPAVGAGGATLAPADPTQDPAALERVSHTQEITDQEARTARALREAARERGIRGNLADHAYRLVDPSGLEFDANGDPTNAAEVVDAFKREHEKLFGIDAAAGSFDGGVRSEYVVPESPNTIMNRTLREQADRQRGRR